MNKRIFRTSALAALVAVVASLGLSFPASSATLPQQAQDATSFWTPERLKQAVAFDMVFEPGAKVAKRVPVAKAAAKPGGGTTSTSVVGASWNNGGLPLTASGKVFFAIGTSYYQCSGALATDTKSAVAIVLTAGHCVYDNDTSAYVTNWIFIPSYDSNIVSISGCSGSSMCWSAEKLYAHIGFTSQVGFTNQATWYDWGFARITTKNSSGLLPDQLSTGTPGQANSFPISFTALTSSTQVSSLGYPAAGKYKGQDLIYSSGPIAFDTSNGSNTYSLVSNMTGGCSGGPWLSGMSTTAPYGGILSSVNSYKYGTTTYIYGPKFNGFTSSTYSDAVSGK